MNDYHYKIARIFDSAQQSIKIAVSWFTDEYLIQELISQAKKGKTVNILLSASPANYWRYNKFDELKNSGAQIRKRGNEDALDGSFMHLKNFLIDEKILYGGSYNFTFNARTNDEHFDRFYETSDFNQKFNSFWDSSSTYFDISRFEVFRLIEKLKSKRSLVKNELNITSDYTYPSKMYKIIEDEKNYDKKKSSKLQKVSSLANASATVCPTGQISQSKMHVSSKPHKFYGGSISPIERENRTKNTFAISRYQKYQIENKFNFLSCRIENGVLIAKGKLQPELCNEYEFQIKFRNDFAPQVFILSPEIEAKPEIHMYDNGSLCLFYPKEQPWKNSNLIAEYIIPWIVEWIYYYEIYLLSGKWEGLEQPH